MWFTWLVLVVLTIPQAVAGASAGPRAVRERVEPSKTDVYHVAFEGGALATVSLEGDHASNLDLSVVDESGFPIATDAGSTDTAYLSFVPRRSGTFAIKVKNLGDKPNAYVLYTN